MLACKPVMASRDRHTLSRSWSAVVAGIWRTVGGSLSSGVLQYRNYCDEGLDGCVPPSPSAVEPLSRKFSPTVPTTWTFGARRPVYDGNAFPLRQGKGFRVYQPIVNHNPTALNKEEPPVGNCIHPSRKLEQESCHGSPREDVLSGEQLPIGPACGRGNVHLANTSITSEAIAILKHRLQQGLSIDSYMFVEILKRCSMEKDLTATRQVHDFIIHSGMQKHRYVATTLLNVYIKCGRLQDAHRVFDGLERSNRNVITWNVMIGAYAKRGCGMQAYRLYQQMKHEGFIPDAYTYSNILNASASAGAFEWVKEVHSHARTAGLESDLRVGNALVHMYAKSGSTDDARQVFDRMEKRDIITWNIMIGAHAESGNIDEARIVFDKMEKRNVITWTTMIGAYAKCGCGMEAYRLFKQMKREGFIPDAFTYSSLLNASASGGALEWVREVHRHARSQGLESDLRVGNALVHMYAKCGSFHDARLVFDRMEKRDVITWNTMIGAYAESGSIDDARLVFDRMEERDVITWTIMIGAYAKRGCGMEAYGLFQQMKREGFIPDAFTYSSILNASASTGALEWVKEVHSHARSQGLESDLHVGNALVHMYAKCGSFGAARVVFDRLEKRDVITWNTMIGAYAESGCGREAYQLFLEMKRKGFIPDAVTYSTILNASASAGGLKWVKEVHTHARVAGLESDLRVSNALVHMYAKCGSIDEARLVFDRMKKRDVITWNIIIGAYAESGCGMEAYRLFLLMKQGGFIPDGFTYSRILNAAASAGALEWVKEVHSQARRAGLESDVRVGNALVNMFSKTGSIDDARLIFDKMEKRDVVTWNTMIGGLAQHGYGHEALELFRNMNADFVKPNETTFLAVLSACCHAGLLDDGRRLFGSMTQDFGIEPTVMHYTCMVDLLGRAGHLEEAKLLIGDMPIEPDGVTWKALLGACRTYGNVELGEFAAKEVLKLEPKDPAAYVLLSNIYAAAGKWEKVSMVRTMMQEKGVRKEPGRSWIEVDNKIHEFVVGDTSHPEAKVIYTELDKLTEKLKAEGYIPDTQLVLRNIDEEDKELALCSHSEKLAIVYGLMRTPPGKPIRVYKNLRVCSDCHKATRLISKVTGREIIARDAIRFHHFKDGVCSCGDYW